MSADADAQYDIFDDHVCRFISQAAVPSPYLDYDVTEQEISDTLADLYGIVDTNGQPLAIGPGDTARAVLAQHQREAALKEYGLDLTDASDTEILDGIYYHLFPNFSPWAGYAVPIAYRFLPHADDPGQCLFQVYVFNPYTKRPALPANEEETPVRIRHLGPDELYSDAEELGPFGPIFDQDHDNMIRLQRGMQASRTGEAILGVYGESRIRHYHRTLERYVGRP